MIVRPEVYAAKQAKISDTAQQVFAKWADDNPDATEEEVKAEALAVIRQFGDASAELAVEYYMALREEALGDEFTV